MDPQDDAQKVKEIYDEAIKKLESLGFEHKSIVRSYLKEVESKQIEDLKQSLESELSK